MTTDKLTALREAAEAAMEAEEELDRLESRSMMKPGDRELVRDTRSEYERAVELYHLAATPQTSIDLFDIIKLQREALKKGAQLGFSGWKSGSDLGAPFRAALARAQKIIEGIQ